MITFEIDMSLEDNSKSYFITFIQSATTLHGGGDASQEQNDGWRIAWQRRGNVWLHWYVSLAPRTQDGAMFGCELFSLKMSISIPQQQ